MNFSLFRNKNNGVGDAQPLVWHFFTPSRLGSAARTILRDAVTELHQIYLPAVALAEIIMVMERGRIPGVPLFQLIKQLSMKKNLVSFDFPRLLPDTVINSHRLTAIPDIFEQLIVAEAVRLGLPLITKDSVITASGLVTVVWD